MSRRMLLEDDYSSGLTPVMDGLVCWLDGRDGKGTDTIWKDRSGNANDIEIFNPPNTTPNNVVYFSRILKSYGKSKNIFNLSVNSEKTIEIKYRFDNYHQWGRVFSFSNRYLIQTNSYVKNQANTGQKWTPALPIESGYNMITIVSNSKKNSVYNNSNLLYEDSANTDTVNLGYLYLNKEKDTIQIPIDLFIASIRIYNRALTEEEIQQNYLYEQSIERG